MKPLPSDIRQFIAGHHVVSLACRHEEDFWVASCFYLFDETQLRLIILTNSTTRHGSLMSRNPQIVGTIAGQPNEIREIEGVQFSGTVKQLDEQQQAVVLPLFYAKHQITTPIPSEVWEIVPDYIKYTSNKITFAQKQEWFRNEKGG